LRRRNISHLSLRVKEKKKSLRSHHLMMMRKMTKLKKKTEVSS